MEKLMAGERMEKNRNALFDSNFLAFTDIRQSLSLTRRWDLRMAGSRHRQMCA